MINARKRLETDLQELMKMIFLMGRLSSNALEKSVAALKNMDIEAASQVIASDDTIDDLEEKIDNCCMEFAARYQPLGEDLRIVTSLMHIAVDLERIGDYGDNIAKIAIDASTLEPIKPLVDIPIMAEKIANMMEIAMMALDTRSPELAFTVFPLDDEVDDLEKSIIRELFSLLLNKPELIERSFQLMGVSRTLERAGDHVTNIAERVIFMYTGRTARASRYRRKKAGELSSPENGNGAIDNLT